MIVNKYNQVTPEEIQAQIDSALTPYWESGETKDYVDTSLSGITIPDPTVLKPVAELPVSAETGAVMATKPSLGFWSTSGLQRVYTIVAETGNGDLDYIGENTIYRSSEFSISGYVTAQYGIQYQSEDPDFVGWRFILNEIKDEQTSTASAYDLQHEGTWAIMSVPLDESETKSLVCTWNAATNQLFFKAVVNATSEEVAFDFNVLSPGTEGSVYQYLGTWNEIGGGDMSGFYTSAQTDEKIASAVTPVANRLEEVEQVTASALTELHDGLLEVSAATSGKADAVNAEANPNRMQFPTWNEQGVITSTNSLSTVYQRHITVNDNRDTFITPSSVASIEFYAPTTPGTAGQVLVSVGSGAPVWSAMPAADVTKAYVDSADTALQNQIDTMDEVVSASLVDLEGKKVESQDVKHIVKLTQAQYDQLATKDPYTFYIIVSN